MDFSAFKRNTASVKAGQWVDDIPGMGDMRLRVRGLSSPDVVALQSRKERKVPRNERERDGDLKPETKLAVFCEVLHEAVLLEWDGIDDSGTPIPYDPDIARKWLTDPDFQPFADAVTWAARIVDSGRATDREEVAGNSRRPSKPSSGATA